MLRTLTKWLKAACQNQRSRSLQSSVGHSPLKLETLEERLTPSVSFGFAIGGDISGSIVSSATATDNSGNVYITGSLSGTVHFGTTAITAKGTQDAFIAKYSDLGALAWVADLGGSADSLQANAIAVDGSGNVYTTGSFQGSHVNFDPNSFNNELTSSDGGADTNAYVSKLNPLGQYVFGVALGTGLGSSSVGNSIAVDNSDSVYTTGSFSGTNLNFNPFGTNLLTSGGGLDAAYVSKLTSSGHYVYAAEIGGGGYTQGTGIAVDALGDAYSTGDFTGSNVNFDPNSSNHKLSSSHNGTDYNVYVSKLNSMGQYDYAVDLGSGGNAYGGGIAVDGAGDAYTDGEFTGKNLNFDPNSTNHQLSSSHGGMDVTTFVSKLNSSGQYLFGVAIASGGDGENGGLALDSSSNVYITGFFQGTGLNFDPNSNSHQLSSSSSGNDQNAYVVELSSSGQFIFAVDLGYGSNNAAGAGIAVDPAGDIFTSGYFSGAGANFNPFGSADLSSPNASTVSFFLSKLTQPAYQSIYATPAYDYAYFAYIYAYDAYINGTGSYTAFVDAYDAQYFAQNADMFALAGNAASAENYAYYAYYYGYFGQYFAYQDYVNSGNTSLNSYYAYYDGYFGQVYSYYTYLGQ